MAETSLNTYSTDGSNNAGALPNKVAVVNDGTSNRQVVVLGAGDGSTNLNDGSAANPLNNKITDGTNTAKVTANNELYAAPGVYQASPPGTYSNGQRVPLLTDNYGQAKVVASPATATGSAVPSNGFFMAGVNPSGNLTGLKTKADGTLVPGTTATSAITSVVSAITSTQLLAANTNRTGAYFYNDSSYPLYIAFAGSASTSAYTVQVASQGFYEMPSVPVYTGAIFGIWPTANGNARITELS